MNAGGLDGPRRPCEDARMNPAFHSALLRFRAIRAAATRARDAQDEDAQHAAQQALYIAANALTVAWARRKEVAP